MSLSFILKCKPLIINCSINEKKIEFEYATETLFNQYLNEPTDQKCFKYLCTLDNQNNTFEVFSDTGSLFNFYLANGNDILDKNLKYSKHTNKLNEDLYKILFTKIQNSSYCPPVLLIGGNDGYIYWKTFDLNESSKDFNLNKNILLNASSPIICINSFKLPTNQKSNFDDLFNTPIKKTSNSIQNTSDNCLFAVTKSGRIHLFSFISDYEYKIAVLPHYIKQCIKAKHEQNQKDYLIYSTKLKQIYAVQLESCLKNGTVQAKLLKSNCDVNRFFLDENDALFALSIAGKKIKINFEESSNNLNDIKNDSNADKSTMKNSLDKLCYVSNQIVKTQLKLDKLNLALKQLNILQTIRLNKMNNFCFQIEKSINKNATLELTITNLNAQLDEDFKKSYLISSSIQLSKGRFDIKSFNWITKCEQFTAIKPHSKHLISFDLVESMKNKYFPLQINIHLIFDTKSYLDFSPKKENNIYLNDQFLFEANKRDDNFLKEFVVCIYNSKLTIGDLFVNSSKNLQASNEALEIKDYSMQFNLLMNCSRRLNTNKNLDNLWIRVGIKHISQDDDFFLRHIKDTVESNEKNEQNINKESPTFANLTLIITKVQNDENQKALVKKNRYDLAFLANNFNKLEYFYQNLIELIYLKNQFLLPEFLQKNLQNDGKILSEEQLSDIKKLAKKLNSINDRKPNKNISIIDNSIQMDGIEETSNLYNKNVEMVNPIFYSMETLLELFEIYLELRSCLHD